MINPLERIGPKALFGTFRSAFWAEPVGWAAVLFPLPWFLLVQTYFAVNHGVDPVKAVGASALALVAQVAVVVPAVWGLVPPISRRLGLRGALIIQLSSFAVAGMVRAAIMVSVVPESPGTESNWVLWGWLAFAWAVSTMIWMSATAMLADWAHLVREQRLELEGEYARQVLARDEDARALVEASGQLAAVRASTHQALDDISDRLHPGMSLTELGETVTVIDDVVASMVRPTSHTLAAMPGQIDLPAVEPLWQGWRKVFPALIVSWPSARPFQPALVGSLCFPMVLASEFAQPPHALGANSLLALGVLLIQVLALTAADRYLAPRLREMEPRTAVGVVFSAYLVLYFFGLSALAWGSELTPGIPLDAFLVPPMLSTIAGWMAAFGKIRAEESIAARALIQHTDWEIRRTRQRLWAQRRRLAMALHGRVQANLTAAGLMLAAARDRAAASGETLSAAEIGRIQETLKLANLTDQGSVSPPAERLATVTSVWAGVLAVTLDLRPDGERLMRGNPDLADACIEVLREVLLNAVRHSGATEAEVVVAAQSETLLCLRVAEMAATREPLGPIGGPGLGRSLMHSLAVDWAETDSEDGRITVAMLAAGVGDFVPAQASARLGNLAGLS